MEERTARASRFDRAWLGVCVAGFAALCWLMRGFVTDDAWISARYAENLANGHGFVWNPSGPRAEGFSNPILVAGEALAHLLGLSALGAARALGVASGIALLLVVHRLGPAVVGARGTRVALALTAFYPPVALWSVGGLETMPVALALTAGALLLARRPSTERGLLLAGAPLAVLPWLRPEGLVVALAAVAAAEGPGLVRRGGRREAVRRLAAAAVLPLAAQLALELLRLLVYGHWLPNSVVYKAGGRTIDTFSVIERFWDQSAPVVVVAALGLALARGRQRLLAVPPAVYALGSIGVLDSVNSFSRFLLPVWPLLALLAGVAVAAVSVRIGRASVGFAAACALFAVVAMLGAPDADVDKVTAFSSRYASCRQAARNDAADWLLRSTPPGAVFSVSDAGLVPARGGERTAVDQLMLNDPLIQRTGPLAIPRRVSIVFARRPDVLVLSSRVSSRFVARYEIDRRITIDPRFRQYSLEHVARGGSPGCTYHLFMYERHR